METVGYAVEFRNMHTALHGLICFTEERDAELAYDVLKRLDEIKDSDDADVVLVDVLDGADFVEGEYGLPEIDYRDVYEDYSDGYAKYYDLDDDERVEIVNGSEPALDLYM